MSELRDTGAGTPLLHREFLTARAAGMAVEAP